jgi:hypothetical protein
MPGVKRCFRECVDDNEIEDITEKVLQEKLKNRVIVDLSFDDSDSGDDVEEKEEDDSHDGDEDEDVEEEEEEEDAEEEEEDEEEDDDSSDEWEPEVGDIVWVKSRQCYPW